MHKSLASINSNRMKLIFLGTSAALPTEKRGLSCVCIQREGEILMFDVGEATQVAYLRSGLGWNKDMKIFVTHLHGDHCIGILGMLQTLNMRDRTKPLEIYGPDGINEFISTYIKMLNFKPNFPILINTIQEGLVCNSKEYYIYACMASHPVTAFSYLFREKDLPGKFNREKALELGVPEGRLWKKLQEGNTITIHGKEIEPAQILGRERPGKKIGISGDTRSTKQLEKFFENCDYLVFDATFLEELKSRAEKTGHSTARQAAILGRNANVKNLILTHFSTRYSDDAGHLKEAGKIHDSVICAKDLLEIKIR